MIPRIDIHRINVALLGLAAAALVTTAVQSLPAASPSSSMPPIPTASPAEHFWTRTEAAFPARNVFDPDGTAWDTPAERLRAVQAAAPPQAAGGRPAIGGTVVLGDIRGVFAGRQFVPVGVEFDRNRLESVGEGRAHFVDPGGAEIVVEPGAARAERIRILMQGDRPNGRDVAPRKTP